MTSFPNGVVHVFHIVWRLLDDNMRATHKTYTARHTHLIKSAEKIRNFQVGSCICCKLHKSKEKQIYCCLMATLSASLGNRIYSSEKFTTMASATS